ncbi:permease [Desulfobacter sp.]|uniref:permease n=1 Tax=Desulfobacter sp. TaxID=2294 RepID=UPI000E81D966|nr:permease [Desulfobacter sp.]HBT87453.1 permease [Desulfobacter sp.]
MTLNTDPFPLAPKPVQSVPRSRISSLGEYLQICFLVVALSLALFSAQTEAYTTFAIIFSAIVLEALPFMLLGTLLGGVVEVFLSRETMIKFLPANKKMAIVAAAFLGIIFPVCECAIVPVVRKFIQKGMPLGASVAFLLGGPIVNPLVFSSTLVAYSFSWNVAILRMIQGLGVAVAGGLLVDSVLNRDQALLPGALDAQGGCCHAGCGHNHDPGRHFMAKLRDAFSHGAADFYDIGRFLIFGAFIAALLQTHIPRQAILSIANGPVLSTGAMMALAVILNLCSEADAFISASFRSLGIPLSAQLAFMVLGPMLDVKLVLMYLGIFTRKMILVLVSFVCLAVFLISILMEVCQWLAA